MSRAKKNKKGGKKWLEGQSRQLFTTSSSAKECNSRRPCVYLYTLSSLKGVLYRNGQREKETERDIYKRIQADHNSKLPFLRILP